MEADKVRVLVLASTYPRWPGDTQPGFVHELCRRLARYCDVTVLAPHTRGALIQEVMDDVRVRRYRYLPERWETLAYGGGIPERLRRSPLHWLQVPFLVLGMLFAAMGESRRRRIEVIHAHWLLPQGLAAVLVKLFNDGRPAVVCTSHGADLFAFNSTLLRRLKSFTVRHADAVTAVSRAMLPALIELGAAPGSTSVISMGVDVETRFTPPADEAGRRRTIVFAGRLVEKKGVRHLIEAFMHVRKALSDVELVIAGDGPERGALEQLAADSGVADGIRFAGAVTQEAVAQYFRGAGCAVFPFVVAGGGDQEGLGPVVVEAQACACPVIASDLAAVRDTITPGRTGLLAAPGDARQLAERILALLNDPALARELGARGRRAALARFHWDDIAGRYFRVLEEAARTSGD